MPGGRPKKAMRVGALSVYPEVAVLEEIKNIASEEDRPVAKVAAQLMREGLDARKAKANG